MSKEGTDPFRQLRSSLWKKKRRRLAVAVCCGCIFGTVALLIVAMLVTEKDGELNSFPETYTVGAEVRSTLLEVAQGLSQEPRELSDVEAELSHLQEIMNSQKQTIHELHDDLFVKQGMIKHKDREVAFLREQVITLEKYADQVENTTNELDKERAKTLDFEAQLTRTEEKLRDLEGKEGELEQTVKQFRVTQTTLQEAESMITVLEEKNEALVEQEKVNRREMDFLFEEVVALGDVHERVVNEKEGRLAQEIQLQELQKLLDEKNKTLGTVEATRSTLEHELVAVRLNYQTLLKESKDRAFSEREVVRLTKSTPSKTHKVEKGETLMAISKKYYGTTRRWRDIYETNRLVLSDQNNIPIGITLVIPN